MVFVRDLVFDHGIDMDLTLFINLSSDSWNIYSIKKEGNMETPEGTIYSFVISIFCDYIIYSDDLFDSTIGK